MRGGCCLLIPFPLALVLVREWLSKDLQCFRARALVFTWLQCIVFFQAVSASASVWTLFCILSSWAAGTLLFLRSLPALPSFLLGKGIALSERKVLGAEWNLPENALLFRVRRMKVGVGQKPNCAVGIAARAQAPRQRREKYGSPEKGWWVVRKGAAPSHLRGRGDFYSEGTVSKAQASLDSGSRRWQGAPRGGGRKLEVLFPLREPFLLLRP